MLAGVAAMQDGLQRAGFTVLAETLGLRELPVSLLRVKTPHASIEAAEQWLLRQLQPHTEEAWAEDVSFCLSQRWRDYYLLSGSDEEIEALAQRIGATPSTSFVLGRVRVGDDRHYEFEGAPRFAASQRHLHCFARTALEVVRFLPGVRALGPEPIGDPRRWLAIEVAHEPRKIAELEACGQGFDALGFATCRYTWRDGGSVLLAIDAGDAMWDELEVQIAARLPKAPAAQPAWLRPYKPWSWEPGRYIDIHRQPAPDGWLLRAWLERQLGMPVVHAGQPLGQAVAISVPPAQVARALELLARRPATIRPDDVAGMFVPKEYL
jgi:hypothetical protein